MAGEAVAGDAVAGDVTTAVAPRCHTSCVRIVHTSDWQLGMQRWFLGSDDAEPRFDQARLDAVRAVLELARNEGAAAVVVAGDAFDDNQVADRTLARASEVLASASVPVVIVPGNHDSLEPASVYWRWTPPGLVRVAERPGVVDVAPGLEVVAAPFPTRRPSRDLVKSALEGLRPAPPGVVRVLVAHGQLQSYGQDPYESLVLDDQLLRDALDRGVVHYVALGDRHSCTEHTGVDPRGRVWHSGTPEVTAFDDPDPGWALLVDVDPATRACRVERRRVGQWQFLEWERTLAAADDVEALADELARIDRKERSALRLHLSGQLRLADRARLADVLDDARLAALASVDVRDETLATVPELEDLDGLALSGYAASALEELRDLALRDSEQDARTAQDAIALLVRLTGDHADPAWPREMKGAS